MRISYITAGAGGMYCGTCIRDNALAAALIAQGHDVLLVPMYTPTLTDEDNVSTGRVFFSGVSIVLEQRLSLFRHTPWLVDRLWESSWLLRTVSGHGLQTRPEALGALTVSMLAGQHGRQAKEIEKLVYWLGRQPIPDVFDLSNSMLIALARPLKEAFNVPVCCTLQGEDIFLDNLGAPFRDDARQLIQEQARYVDRFLAVSHYCADHMSDYLGIPRDRIDVLPLGINVDGFERGHTPGDGAFRVGYFGRIAPEKGVHVLCDVYRRLRERQEAANATLRLAGYLAPEDRAYLRSITDQVGHWGLDAHVAYDGMLDRAGKIAFLQNLDLFVVPAVYDDPKGLVLLEAMACGVPVVVPRRGTYTELVEATGGGVLVPPDDLDALAEALIDLERDAGRRRMLGDRGAAAVREQFGADAMAGRAATIYQRVSAPVETPAVAPVLR